MKKWLLGACLPLLILACAKPTSLDYLGINSVRVLSFGFKESTVAAGVSFYNPNRSPLTMKKAEVKVYINDNYFGTTILDSTIHIPKKDTFNLPVVLTVDMKNLGLGFLQTLGQEQVKVKLEGSTRIGRSGIFINYPIRYEGMQEIKL
ncbi:MAG: LEA type 2 family protein [Candidatus Pseudobacter hemicellulosilyticus]|uniref:LEA type 2 family protein n=1 Tax=Candidatus Pseudobacter hemicellulosilyticus TaxID=3121375 RepID=A0AAJ5WRS4_9BACT|nr:MAG: LEA type 2 family protein [Pseudobacter sp.]